MLRKIFLSSFALITIIIIFSGFALCLSENSPLKEAYYYNKLEGKKVQCALCPRKCVIPTGKRGFCNVRENKDGKLYSLVYAKPVSIHIDPVEKKPLFHFLPGSAAFSIATAGCNLRCKFCQNWQISQSAPEDVEYVYLPPQELINEVKKSGAPIIAYTYSEPTIFYEYMLETAKLAKKAGIRNVMHSAGFINEEPLRELIPYLDAVNIDLKAFDQKFYDEMCSLGKLDDVLRTLKILKQQGVWLEITNLILPGINDSSEEIRRMCEWIRDNLGSNVPLHFSRFWPMYKLINLSPTPVSTLEKSRDIAREVGLKYVYIGNVPGNDGETTYCAKSGKVAIKRVGYQIIENNLDENGFCKNSEGEKIDGVWR